MWLFLFIIKPPFPNIFIPNIDIFIIVFHKNNHFKPLHSIKQQKLEENSVSWLFHIKYLKYQILPWKNISSFPSSFHLLSPHEHVLLPHLGLICHRRTLFLCSLPEQGQIFHSLCSFFWITSRNLKFKQLWHF